jgi:hypothetical protein
MMLMESHYDKPIDIGSERPVTIDPLADTSKSQEKS